MEGEVFKCSGDCLKCPRVQWAYCAAQNTRNLIEMQKELSGRISALEELVLADVGSARKPEEEKSQNEGGEENRPS